MANKLSKMMDLITSDLEADKSDGTPIAAPADGILQSRARTLAQISQGKVKNTRDEYVDPNRCRPWRLHNRHLDALNEENCRDLIDALLVAKAQKFPAIVRPLKGDPDHDFEIIAGVRRWWAIKWLRANHHPDFEYLITVSNLSDEEAFIVSDIENRARKDISDWERANDYQRAIQEFFGGTQSALAQHMRISKGHLSRLLSILEAPPEIIAAYPSPTLFTESLFREIKPHLDNEQSRAAMIAAAVELAQSQGPEPITGRAVTNALILATRAKRSKRGQSTGPHILDGKGRVLLNYRSDKRGLHFFIPATQTTENGIALEEAFRQLLREFAKGGQA